MNLKFLYIVVYCLFLSFISLAQPSSGSASEDPGWDDGYKGYLGGEVNYECLGNNTFRFYGRAYFSCNNPLTNVKDIIMPFERAQFIVIDLDNNLEVDRVTIALEDSADQYLFGTEKIPCFIDVNAQLCYWFKGGASSTNVQLAPNENGYLVGMRLPRQGSANIQRIADNRRANSFYYTYIPPFASNSCINSSARFTANPPSYLCVNVPFTYNLNAYDLDGDSLSYGFCNLKYILTDPITDEITLNDVQLTGGLSAEQFMWAESKPQIDPVTGQFYLTPISAGIYTAGICVYEWRDGRVINTTIREIDLVVQDCTKEKVANIPAYADAPNTFAIVCDGYKVQLVNKSLHASSYLWKLGFENRTSTEFEPTVIYPDTGTYEVTLYVDLGENCADSITRLVKIYPEYKADFVVEGNLCLDSVIVLKDATYSTAKPVNFWSWNINKTGEGQLVNEKYLQENVTSTIEKAGDWFITLNSRNAQGCTGTVSKQITIVENPFQLFKDTIININNSFVINPQGAAELTWYPSSFFDDPKSITPTLKLPQTGDFTFLVNGVTPEGCGIIDSFKVTVIGQNLVFMPNAFTPNNDGLNDVVQPVLVGMSKMKSFRIFDKNGTQVYYSLKMAYDLGWDGTYKNQPANVGVYYWIMELEDGNGNEIVEKGDLTLIR